MSSIKEELRDLKKQAEDEASLVHNSLVVLNRYLEQGKNTLDDIEHGTDFFYAIAFLNAQSKAPKIEHFIRKKLGHNMVNSAEGRGDGEKDGLFYEYKISTTNKNEKINALQIRLWQNIDFYLLGYIDEKRIEASRLYLVGHKDMVALCEEYGTATHGTKDANISNNKVEMSLRVEMKTNNNLLNIFEQEYRVTDLEQIIFIN